jgi:hypothetical protein
LAKLNHHHHSAYVVDFGSSGFAPIYSKISENLAAGYAVVYLAEDDTKTAIHNMKNFGIDADHFLSIEALQIIDRDSYYNPNKELEPQELLDQFSRRILSRVDFKKFKGMLAIGSPGPDFLQKGRLEPFLEYEHKIGKEFDVPVEVVCCYRSEDIMQFKFSHLVSVIASHAYVITPEGAEHKRFNSDAIISFVVAGMERSLGANATRIVLKTLEMVCGMSKEKIILQPRTLEEALEKMLDIVSSRIVLTGIESEIRNALLSKTA